MDNQFPDQQPTIPIAAIKPLYKRRKFWLSAMAIVGVLLLLGLAASMLVGQTTGLAHPQTSSVPQTTSAPTATQNGQSASTPTPTTQARATSTATSTRKPTPTPVYNLPSVTHGRPRLGGPFSDFVGKYGTPTPQGDASSQNFWDGPDQSITISVQRNEQGKVTQINILGAPSWNVQQTQNYCVQFLPDGALQFNATNNQVEYHSSAGDVVLDLQPTSCSLSLAHK